MSDQSPGAIVRHFTRPLFWLQQMQTELLLYHWCCRPNCLWCRIFSRC